jgi:hypothetical protein
MQVKKTLIGLFTVASLGLALGLSTSCSNDKLDFTTKDTLTLTKTTAIAQGEAAYIYLNTGLGMTTVADATQFVVSYYVAFTSADTNPIKSVGGNNSIVFQSYSTATSPTELINVGTSTAKKYTISTDEGATKG